MDNEIQKFVNDSFGEIRTVTINNEPWFVAKDVCDILGTTNPTMAMEGLEDFERAKFNLGRQGEANIISESGFYTLVLRSRKPIAKPFRLWVTREVLPSIRKHEIYATEDTLDAMLNNPDTMIRVLTELKEEREKRIELEKENASLLPDANMARDIIKYSGLYTLKEVADLIESGRTELCTLLRVAKVLSKQTGYNLPLNKYIKQGYFKIKIREKYNTPVTLVTPRGLKFIYRLIKKFDMIDEFDVNALLEAANNMEVA
jgi:anti-repressor protein